MLDCITNSIGIMMHELYNYEIEGMEYLLKINTKKIGLLDMEKIDELYKIGYKTAKEGINNIKEYIK